MTDSANSALSRLDPIGVLVSVELFLRIVRTFPH
jgi:hypothetical protein